MLFRNWSSQIAILIHSRPIIRQRQCNNIIISGDSGAILLFENELHLAGQDYIHRPCSFLPYYCNGNLSDITKQVASRAETIEKDKNNLQCFYNSNSNALGGQKPVVIQHKTIFKYHIIHALTWPIAGMLSSLIICAQFWRHNKDHISRLFVYNSWSLS